MRVINSLNLVILQGLTKHSVIFVEEKSIFYDE